MPTIYLTPETKQPPARAANDHYPTEGALIDAALSYLRQNDLITLPVKSILDAGAGDDGRWGLAAARIFNPQAYLTGVELRDVPTPGGFDIWLGGTDFLANEKIGLFDLIVSNPPYNQGNRQPTLGERFVRQAWRFLNPDGAMIFLLPLDYQVGAKRYAGLFHDLSLLLAMPVVRRVAFKAGTNGGTNNHCIFVWLKDHRGRAVGEPNRWPSVQLWYERN